MKVIENRKKKKAKKLDAEKAHYDFLRGHPLELPAIKYLYDRLNIIDSKTGSLLRLNGVIIGFLGAIVTLLMRDPGAIPESLRPYVFPAIVSTFVLLAFAELLSLWIFWLRFDRIEGEGDLERYKEKFFRITMRREKIFAWVLAASAAGGLIFVLLFAGLASYEALSPPTPTPISTATLTPTRTATRTPAATPSSTSVPTSTP